MKNNTKHKLYKLTNGLKIIYIPSTNIDIIYMNLSVKIGADTEKVLTLEYSHFLEHLFTLLTSEKYFNGIKNREYFSNNNISVNADVVTKNTNFQFVMKHNNILQVIDMLVNSINNFKLDTGLFINEKNSIVEELNNIINDTNYNLETFIEQIIYKNHTRHFTQLKRLENVKNTTEQNILDFFNKYYTTDNMVLSIYGNTNIKSILKLLQGIQKKPQISRLYTKTFKKNKSDIYFFKKKNSNSMCNLRLYFSVPFTFFDEEYYYISSILTILSHDINSILLNKLRNIEGLVYDIYAYMNLDEVNKNLSYVIIETTMDSNKLLRVIEIIIQELDKIKKNGVNIDIINKYKEYLKIKYTNDQISFTPMKLLEEYSKYILWDEKIVDFKQEYSNFSDIDQEELKYIIRKLFNFKKLYIFYDGTINKNKQIKGILNNY